MLTIGSLFSGIGGLELGLEWAGLGPVRWQVERDEFCRRVLARHWPDARRYDDVRTVGADLERVDVICGGFPCQDVSSAGKRAGLAGDRSGLWREFARVVEVTQPRWVVVENVASGATRWVDQVVRDLGQLGYESLPVPVSASDVGAPHRRSRVFIVARHADDARQHAVAVHAAVAGPPRATADADRDELREQSGRRSGAEWLGPREPGHDGSTPSADALREGPQRPLAVAHEGRHRPVHIAGAAWSIPEPDMVRVVHGLPERAYRAHRRTRAARIRALGNSVVPQCAEVVGHVVLELHRRLD